MEFTLKTRRSFQEHGNVTAFDSTRCATSYGYTRNPQISHLDFTSIAAISNLTFFNLPRPAATATAATA